MTSAARVARAWGAAALIAMVASAYGATSAHPVLRPAEIAGSLTVYPDDRRADLFYYPPGDLIIATENGRPELRLLLARYTGSASTGDRGARSFRSILSFSVEMSRPSSRELSDAKRALRSTAKRRVELRPLPIDHIDTVVVYEPIGAAGPRRASRILPSGYLETADAGSRRAFWTERTYTLAMDTHTAQLLWDALQQGQVLVSLGYAFHAAGSGAEEPLDVLSGSPELVAELSRRIDDRKDRTAARAASRVVRAGATAITIDGRSWPELLARIDLNDRVPPGYALLDVYCYDFNNDLRSDLHLKRIEFEARGVGGTPVSGALTFKRGEPEVYAQGLRFPFAVRLDEPYRYRVVEVTLEGDTRRGSWRTVDSWARMLDVTSSPEQRTPEATGEEQGDNEL